MAIALFFVAKAFLSKKWRNVPYLERLSALNLKQ